MRGYGKKLFFIIVLISICLGIILIYSIFNRSDLDSSQKDMVLTHENNLEKVLLSKLSLANKSDLNKVATNKFNVNSVNLGKTQYKGMFVGISNEKISFSAGSGFANVKNKALFKINSAFFIGDYQDFLNNAILVKMVQNKEISRSDHVYKYFKKFPDKDITINDFFEGKKFFCIKKDNHDLGDLKEYTVIPKGYIAANSFLKMQLISKITNESYKVSFKHYVISMLKLSDTRFYVNGLEQANDVVGYRYYKHKKALIQRNEIGFDKSSMFQNQIRMSVSDIILSNIKVLQNSYFDARYNKLFYKMNNIDNTGSSFSTKGYKLTTHNSGQSVLIRSNLSGSKWVLVASNFPNRKISDKKQLRTLYSLFSLQEKH